MNTAQHLSRAIFLDRDGTILKEIQIENSNTVFGYLTKAEQVELIEGSAEAIGIARRLGYKIIIVSNQSAIARGMLTEETLEEINGRMYALLKKEDSSAIIDDFFYSPYHIEGKIEKFTKHHESRKPEIGMLLDAQKKHNLDLSLSYMIGDSESDMAAGTKAGCKNILVLTGYGNIVKQKGLDESIKIDFIADNLSEAVKFIVKNEH